MDKIDTDELYKLALLKFKVLARSEPDYRWRSFLRLITSANGRIWDRLHQSVDWRKQSIDFDAFAKELQYADYKVHLIAQTTKSLFLDEGDIDEALLERELDPEDWLIVQKALEMYRRKQ